jgi:hypothetical protein
MKILGHAQMSTTMDIYGQVLPSTQRAATNKLDAMLGEAADSNQETEQDQGDQPTQQRMKKSKHFGDSLAVKMPLTITS